MQKKARRVFDGINRAAKELGIDAEQCSRQAPWEALGTTVAARTWTGTADGGGEEPPQEVRAGARITVGATPAPLRRVSHPGAPDTRSRPVFARSQSRPVASRDPAPGKGNDRGSKRFLVFP